MTVTHDQILALMVLKDQRIISLEATVAELQAEVANKDALIAELKKAADEKPAAKV